MSYAKVRPVGFDYKEAKIKKTNFKKEVKNPQSKLFLRLLKLGKIPVIYTYPDKVRVMTYSEWDELAR